MAQVSELSGPQAADGAFGDRILALVDHLASWSENSDGLTCTYLSTAHLAVAEELAGPMKNAGFTVEIDTVENVIGRYPSRDASAKTVIVGSHYDTVRNAGKYDGRLGILVAVVVAEHLARNDIRLPFNLEVIAFSEEEGVRFPVSYTGSRAVAGRFEGKLLESRDVKGIALHKPYSKRAPIQRRSRRWRAAPRHWTAILRFISSKVPCCWRPICRSAWSPRLPAAHAIW